MQGLEQGGRSLLFETVSPYRQQPCLEGAGRWCANSKRLWQSKHRLKSFAEVSSPTVTKRYDWLLSRCYGSR